MVILSNSVFLAGAVPGAGRRVQAALGQGQAGGVRRDGRHRGGRRHGPRQGLGPVLEAPLQGDKQLNGTHLLTEGKFKMYLEIKVGILRLNWGLLTLKVDETFSLNI